MSQCRREQTIAKLKHAQIVSRGNEYFTSEHLKRDNLCECNAHFRMWCTHNSLGQTNNNNNNKKNTHTHTHTHTHMFQQEKKLQRK